MPPTSTMSDKRLPKRIACPVCGTEGPPRVWCDRTEWLVAECSTCTYAWVIDIVDAPEDTAFGWREDVVRESEMRTKMYEDRLSRASTHEPYPKAWLDVGCGGGGLLSCAARAGYVVEGVDPAPSADAVSSRFHIPVHRNTLKASMAKLSQSEYGVISYIHTLEHVMNPVEELQTARQLLGPRGVLMVEVPFFGRLSWRVLRARHRHFYRRHRSYFNDRSLPTLLARTGYEVTRCEPVPYWITVGWLAMRLGERGSALGRFLPKSIARRSIRVDLNDVLIIMAHRTE